MGIIMAQAAKTYTDEELEIATRLYDDYEYYALHALKVKPKDKNDPRAISGLVPFEFNTAQRYIHWRLEKQKKEIGKVRAYILKGRQQGCSTYIGGRYFHRTTMNYGIKTFIQTHSKKATNNLYGISKRYLNNLPFDLKPSISISNTTDLTFDQLDSGYTVSTAGSKETGRSDTVDLLHGSEVAFWGSTYDHTAGLIQAVPDAEGTEIIHESTANGMGGFFHKGYISAAKGENGDYIAIFVPWFWQDEYRKKAPEDFALTEEEAKLVELYTDFPEFDENGNVAIVKGKIDNDQMYWRRCKIAEFSGDEAKCNQEYPFDSDMAFRFSAVKSFIKADTVLAALQRPLYNSVGAILFGFDPSFTDSGDRKSGIYRQGSNAFGLEYPRLKDHDAQVAYCDRKLQDDRMYIDRLYIDFGGGGINIAQSLWNLNDSYRERVIVVNAGESDYEDHKYVNKRAGMSGRLKDHLLDSQSPLAIEIDPKHKEAFIIDMTAEGYIEDYKTDRIMLEKKDKVKDRLGISPDGKNALDLTYAEPFVRKEMTVNPRLEDYYEEPKECRPWFDQ